MLFTRLCRHLRPLLFLSVLPVAHAGMKEAGDAVATRFIQESSNSAAPATYMSELAAEGLLEWGRVSGQDNYRRHVHTVVAASRGLSPSNAVPWRKQPFSCLPYALHEDEPGSGWLAGFVASTEPMRGEIWRDPAGIILHPRGQKRGGGEAMLIDAMQEYAARCARMGAATGDGWWHDECARQFREYRRILRDPATGLYSQGRGWLKDKPEALSPGTWSRGHGWLIRGMEQSLRSLPQGSAPYNEVLGYLTEMADALIKVQRPDGMWPCLLNRPAAETPPETSGTGMIAYHLARALHDGRIRDTRYKEAAMKAFSALPDYVRPDGVVLSVSPGPGPLEEEETWLKPEYPPGDPHGAFAILYAAAGEKLLAP